MIEEQDFYSNYQKVKHAIEIACEKCSRSVNEITLLPVTKNWPVDAVNYCKNAGINIVGENRVQEAIEKMDKVDAVEFELIGHLQRNKVKQVVGSFMRIQTVDSLKLLERIGNFASSMKCKQRVLLQVNAGNDPAKYGVSVENAHPLLEKALQINSLTVDGLMTIAPYAPDDISVAQICFSKLRELRDELEVNFGVELSELSMGMSDDLPTAISEGSTMIRVGSALFGHRQKSGN